MDPDTLLEYVVTRTAGLQGRYAEQVAALLALKAPAKAAELMARTNAPLPVLNAETWRGLMVNASFARAHAAAMQH